MRKIDSHLHLWDLAAGGYDWLTPEAGRLYDTFSAADAAQSLAASRVDGAVLVQADDTALDTQSMLDVADQNHWVLGVVGWVELDHPGTTETQLDRWTQNGAFVGVRHLTHVDPRSDFLDRPGVRRSLSLIGARSLTFDVPDAWPGQLAQLVAVGRDLPDLNIVIDHLGKPPREPDAFYRWRALIGEASRNPRVFAKVSGLRGAASAYSAKSLTPVWDTALELFTPARLMWGSDWPITTGEEGYGATVRVLSDLIEQLAPAERAQLYGATAETFYSLRP